MDFTNSSKVCCDCKQEKPASEYYKQRDSRRPGLVHLRCRCIPCTQAKKNAKRRKSDAAIAEMRKRALDRIPGEPTEQLIERNARDAWRYWINELAPETWLDRYKAARKEAANHRNRENYAAKYREDPISERIRLRFKKERMRRATPVWADMDKIKAIYRQAAKMRAAGNDVHVDHVIPLNGKRVCGLHVHNNLRIIPASDNYAKRNRYEIA